MTDKHTSSESNRDTHRSEANLGQKKAAREKASDEKLAHMDEGSVSKTPERKKEKTARE